MADRFFAAADTAGVMAARAHEPDLVSAAARGEPGARDRLLDRWLPVVYGWCARLGGPRVDAEDAAHDVFLVVFDRLGDLRQPDRFDSWLFGITRRVLANHRRRAWVRRWIPGKVPPVEDGRDPSLHAERSELSRQVARVLDRLGRADREVLVLCDAEEHTVAEAAAILGITAEAARSRLRRARDRFAALAEDSGLATLELLDGGGR